MTATLMSGLLPAAFRSAEAFDDAVEVTLFPEEQQLVIRSGERRRQEFATVRWCARQALGQLGMPPAALVRGRGRAPHWPDGIIGSMTHCSGYRAAAVARIGTVRAVGIDAEPAAPLRDGVLRLAAAPTERAMVDDLSTADDGVPWDRLLFSAKEAAYKAWYPLTHRWLGFHDATAALGRDGTFTVRVNTPPPAADRVPGTFSGRWLICRGLLLTAVVVPADTAGP